MARLAKKNQNVSLNAPGIGQGLLRLHSVFNAVEDVIWVLDKDFRIVDANNSTFSVFGIPPAGVTGKRCWEVVHGTSEPVKNCPVMQMKKTRKRETLPVHVNSRWFSITVDPIFNPSGELEGAVHILRDITDIRNREEELKASQSRIHDLMEGAPHGAHIYHLQDDGKMILIGANPAADKILGIDHTRLTGLTIEEAFPPLKDSEIPGAYRNVARTGKPYSAEQINYLDDRGINGAYEVSAFQTGYNQMVAFFVDITERKKAELQFHIRNFAMESSLSPIGLADLDGKIFYVNNAFVELYKYSNKGEITGRFLGEFASETQVGRLAMESMKESGSFITEGHITCSDGSQKFVKVHANIVRDQAGNPLCLMAAFADITEIKMTGFYRTIQRDLEMSLAGETDMDTIFRLSLNAALELSGMDSGGIYLIDDMTGELNLRIHKGFPEDFIGYVSAYPLGSEQISLILKGEPVFTTGSDIQGIPGGAIRKEGMQLVLLFPIMHKDRVIGCINLSSHTTNQISHGIRDAMEIIGRQVSNAILRARYEKELLASKERAEESDRLKTTFLATMSHEIRTPMNGIIGFTNILAENGLDSANMEKFIKVINDNSRQLLHIIDDIIDISRIEAGQLELASIPFNLNEMLISVFMTSKLKTDPKNLKLSYRFSLPDPGSNIRSDQIKLRQVIENLLSNAIKYTREGSICFGYERADNFLKFFIEDTGMGIAEEFHGVIFDRFWRSSEKMAMLTGGTGLGLSIAKAYVEKFGGKIWLNSTVGKGTAFYFTIPYIPVDYIYKDVQTQPAPVSFRSGTTILVVEDEEANFDYLDIVLKKLNLNVLAAHSGEEALLQIKSHPEIELVLMDIMLPDINGYEVTSHILDMRKDLPIIAQTAFAVTGEREKALEAGCRDYISKPIRKDYLIMLMGKYLK